MILSEKQVSEILATMNKNRDAKTSEFTFLGSCVYDSVTYILLRANEETSEGIEKVLWLLEFDDCEEIDANSFSFPPEELTWPILEAFYKEQKERRINT